MADPYDVRTAVHEQVIDGFGTGGTVRVLRLDAQEDARAVHGWVSEERARFWGMNGLTREQVAEVYGHMDTLDTHHAFLVVKDGEPVALLQTYEPEADRVSECYEVRDGDIGIHLLLAPAGRAAHGPAGPRRCWTSSRRTSCPAWTGDGSWSIPTCATRRPSPASCGRDSRPDRWSCCPRSTSLTCICRRKRRNWPFCAGR